MDYIYKRAGGARFLSLFYSSPPQAGNFYGFCATTGKFCNRNPSDLALGKWVPLPIWSQYKPAWEKIFFPDHYKYSEKDIYNIKEKASENDLKIITTEKDFLRLSEKEQENIEYLKINLEIKNENKFINYLIDRLWKL